MAHRLVLLAVPFLLYVQTFSYDFTYHDDDTMILNNAPVLKQFDLHKLFFSDAWLLDKKIELYRPWQSFTYAVDYYFTGSSATAYHIHNVLLFCIGIQLLYFLLLSFGLVERTAFFLSLIYSVHFLFAHTVSWIPARGDLYLFAFSISTLLLFYISVKKQKNIYSVGSSLLYFLALLSKESAVILMPLVYLVAILFWKMDYRKPKNYLLLAIGIPLTLLYLWMRSQSIASNQSIYSFSGFMYNLPTIPEEVFKFFIPLFFSVMPGYSVIVTLVGLLLTVLFLIMFLLFKNKIKGDLLLAGISFFLLPLLPTLFYKPDFTKFAYDYLDHRIFFPAIGLLLIAYSVFIAIFEKPISVKFFYGLIASMCVITFYNTTNYKNYESYYENATATNLKSGLAHSNYAASLARENKYDKALIHYRKAVELSPDNIEVRMKLADSYLYLKDYVKMIEQCNAVIKINPKFPKSYYNIAIYYQEKKKPEEAAIFVSKAVVADSLNADAFLYRGLISERNHKPDEAISDFKKAVTLNPQLALAFFRMGVINGNNNLLEEALANFKEYVQLNSSDGNGYFYRGQANCMIGNIDAGCADLHIAEKMGVVEARGKIKYWCK